MLDSFEKDLLARSVNLLAQVEEKLDIGVCACEIFQPKYGRGQDPDATGFRHTEACLQRTHLAPFRRLGRHRMAYRSVDESFWSSYQVAKLSIPAKLLYLYFITLGGSAGLYQELPEVIQVRTGLNDEDFKAALNELQGLSRVLQAPCKGLFWVVGQIEHQILTKGQMDKNKAIGIARQMSAVSTEPSIYQVFIEKYGAEIERILGRELPKPLASPLQAPTITLAIQKGKERKGKEKIMLGFQKTPSHFQILTNQIFESWKTKTGQPPNWGDAEGGLLKKLLTRFTPNDIFDCWEDYLKNPDWFAQQNGQSFRNFYASFDKVVSRTAQQSGSVLEDWVKQKKAEVGNDV